MCSNGHGEGWGARGSAGGGGHTRRRRSGEKEGKVCGLALHRRCQRLAGTRYLRLDDAMRHLHLRIDLERQAFYVLVRAQGFVSRRPVYY